MPKNKQTKIIVLRRDIDETTIRKLKQFKGAILVTGNATFKDGTLIPSGLIVLGDLNAGDLTIMGNLLCGGECTTSNLTVMGDVSLEKERSLAEMRMVKIEGKLTSKESVNCIRMDVRGDVEVFASIYSSDIISGGKVFVEGDAVYSRLEAQSYDIRGKRVQITSYN